MSSIYRPGVYTTYEVTGIRSSQGSSGTVGVAAVTATGDEGTVYTITSYASAVSLFGRDCAMTELIRLLFQNGAAYIKAVPVYSAENHETAGTPDDEDYGDAFGLLTTEAGVKVLVCDSFSDDVHALMRTAILSADEANKYCIGVVEATGTVTQITAAAATLNCERIVMVAPNAADDSSNALPGRAAAAVAGAVISESDPAIPLGGAELFGLGELTDRYGDGDIDALIAGGVTPIENVGGTVSVVRGVTTRTTTSGTADSTWRELSTILIVDNVVPDVRDSLKAMFSRAKNTAQTRGAVRTQVIIELERKLAAEIIDGYDNVSVTQSEADATVCDVSFEFTVAHGLGRIRLVAYITV